jgi:hypothetical protein
MKTWNCKGKCAIVERISGEIEWLWKGSFFFFGLLVIHIIGGSIALASTAGTFPLHE